jgi:hypothetical protein
MDKLDGNVPIHIMKFEYGEGTPCVMTLKNWFKEYSKHRTRLYKTLDGHRWIQAIPIKETVINEKLATVHVIPPGKTNPEFSFICSINKTIQYGKNRIINTIARIPDKTIEDVPFMPDRKLQFSKNDNVLGYCTLVVDIAGDIARPPAELYSVKITGYNSVQYLDEKLRLDIRNFALECGVILPGEINIYGKNTN